ncbi:periplasmic C4-dicarboxylate binding protein DctP [Sulfuricella denitrificans skB26]|uniref:Periplasmic C4-dicarboxylate binding protein DctP n=1 Tax=Sulfuricella denitrificans (strain DSM 22764 / NBRC 105220 / skB26) TaxID=1163617 RepID=S6AC11_SULDS|nr:TRAP transporter substrate-binding protein DctP [Sulfuricella denitrificans]BAN35183.1 periplasmic C4-dicarboxylate binding protein DctP [Sulfuricella denitrificans skB26]
MIRKWVFFLLLLCAFTARADETYVLKFATLAPAGSTWMNVIAEWAGKVEKESQGRLKFKFYPGGVSGDEPDMLRKIRFGQIHGAAMTGHGIGSIYSPARVLEIPFLFRNYEEVDYVRAQMMPEIRAGFRKNDYELLGWMEVGFVRFFSRTPINSMDDLKKHRIWQWQGDPLSAAFFTASNIAPVPLPITEVFTSLSTGLIDTVIAPPLGAIALQWFTKTPYMTEVPMADGIGGLVVSGKFFNRLPKDLQELLLRTGNEASEKLLLETRNDNEKSLGVLKQNGVTTTLGWKDIKEADVISIRDRAAADLAKSGYIPTEVYDHARKALGEYREKKAKQR